ncbi:acylneuraminate cytidylyltransferase [Salipaludibacillus neizhouensis]|uniref:Acylneuraminate cytidylyltransferase n=1 Tax=Salipaludibacillus neizhouensis TaxID=885475 RepID=A0A3A9KMI5_9BACI|nr:acylneuraminate cytidylyltransferase family protein [Salipaludibacillus neizhouensis]RKL69105.1 acylneuraminate cytidylyltransferase [Salipaludibacillus neizhouensis]
MSDNDRTVALIPARGGSKTIPYKNIKMFLGKPLIAWTIEVALSTKGIDRVIVSTDDLKIAEIAKHYNAEVFLREKHLALDDSMPIDVIKSVITRLRKEGDSASYMVYLEPTSPLRIQSDIEQSLKLLRDSSNSFKSVATYTEAELNPHRAWKIEDDIPKVFIPGANPWLPRQVQPRAFQLNGAVYTFSIHDILHHAQHLLPEPSGAILMPKNRSIDIDDEVDFLLGELLLKRRLDSECSK